MSLFFYDTCSLMNLQEEAFKEKFYISNITLYELENIKEANFKDEETKYQARKLLKLLKEYREKYQVIQYQDSFDTITPIPFIPQNTNSLNDARIVQCALNVDDDIIFVTDDNSCYGVASDAGLKVKDSIGMETAEYKGFVEIKLTSDDDLAEFYESFDKTKIPKNKYNLIDNQYIIIKDKDNNIIDKYKWLNGKYNKIHFIDFCSRDFGVVKPLDDYQELAFDSLSYNQLTLLCGKAGTGKSLIALGYLFQQLERGEIDKIIIFCNTVATKGSAKLGYYPGTRTEKLLDSQIGNMLISKFGDRLFVEKMINDCKLILLPISDIRGYDTTNMRAGVYIPEAQNLDIELMKLSLQRIGEDSICILDGDYNTQVDLSLYAGSNNGLKRVSKIFKGQKFFGQVNLQRIYRSQIAAVADLM